MSETFERRDGRRPEEKRPVSIETDFVRTAYGSCLIATGNTRVICTASVEEAVPPFLKGKGQGWVTAEYAMLPASTTERKKRDGIKKDGRSVEIQRLIGRSLRQAVDLKALGERTITLDCDVLEADGGTRTASITGAMVALTCAVDRMIREKKLLISPIVHQVAAVSAGIVDNTPCLDLCYTEDSSAQVDMNFVMNESREFIELQGTGEGRAFSSEELATLMSYGMKGVSELMQAQREALGERARHIAPKPLLLAATGNEHKLKELQEMFRDYYTLAPMSAAGFFGPIDENASTFAGNAVEVMRTPYLGKMGHIGMYTEDCEAAVKDLESRGFEVDMSAAGYKPAEYTDPPGEAPEGWEYASGWEDAGETIVQTWTLRELPLCP